MTKTLNYAKEANILLGQMYTKEKEGRTQYFAADNSSVRDFILGLSNENLSLNAAYEFTWEMLNILADSETQDETEAHEAIDTNTEPDVYTSDLTHWLNQSNEHTYWVDEAGENYDAKGFNAVVVGQQLAKEFIGHRLVDWISDNNK